MYYTAIKG